MITFVNTVLVSNADASTMASSLTPDSVVNGQFIIVNADNGAVISTTAGITSAVKRIKVGMFTGETTQFIATNGTMSSVPVIKWSNIIQREDVKSIATLSATNALNSEDTVTIALGSIEDNVANKLAEGGKRVIVRLTFKDLPTRFRKWTESYEYVTKFADLTEDGAKATFLAGMATDIANMINKQYKRARVVATVSSSTNVVLTAMPYDDDNSVDSINWANKVRFNANVYFTDPAADGWESLNKHFVTGLTITKAPGRVYAATGKLVRDREAQAMGYDGILNRGEGTWPIIKPAMRTDISANYNAVTLEFENAYHTADDLVRKTKQTVEIYAKAAVTGSNTVGAILTAFADAAKTVDTTTENASA